METAAEARMAGRSGAVLFAGAGALTLINSFASRALGAQGADVTVLRVCGALSALSAVVMWFFPWSRLDPAARLLPAAWGLALLLASGHAARYATTGQATTAYPVFFVLILAWLGLTERRGIPTAFACITAVGCYWLSASTPKATVSLSGMLLSVATACLVGETIAFVTDRNRRHTRKLGALVRSSSELRDVLTFEEGIDRAVDAIRAILGASAATFVPTHPDERGKAEASPGRDGFRGIGIPLVGPSGTLGVVSVEGVELDPFTDQLIQLISADFGARLEQLRLLEALGEQSLSDALTGVGNRRRADLLTADLRPGDAVLLIDLDNFKPVNDSYGHRAGDQVLEELGAHLKRALREDDSVARYGGDEFLVRLNPKEGRPEEIARRLLDSWMQSGATVSFSVGVAVHTSDRDPQTTFAMADSALYEAKNSGRARVCSASSSVLPQ